MLWVFLGCEINGKSGREERCVCCVNPAILKLVMTIRKARVISFLINLNTSTDTVIYSNC